MPCVDADKLFSFEPIDPELAIAVIYSGALKRSAYGFETEYAGMIRCGQATLWTMERRCFFLVSKRENVLWVHAMEGKPVFTATGVETISELARREDCDCIGCKTELPRMITILNRFGFEVMFVDEHGWTHFRKAV